MQDPLSNRTSLSAILTGMKRTRNAGHKLIQTFIISEKWMVKGAVIETTKKSKKLEVTETRYKIPTKTYECNECTPPSSCAFGLLLSNLTSPLSTFSLKLFFFTLQEALAAETICAG